MLALGIGVLVLIILSVLVRGGITIIAAVLLTGQLALPGLVDVLVWLAAGGYTALCAVGAFVKIAALANAGKTAERFR